MADNNKAAKAEQKGKATLHIKVIRKDGTVEHYPAHKVTDILVKNLPPHIQRLIKKQKQDNNAEKDRA